MVDEGRASIRSIIPAIALTMALSVPDPVRAQATDTGETPLDGSGQTEAQRAAGPIEEIIVTGQPTRGALIRQGAELTEAFYSRLNEIVDDDDFRVTCRTETPAGSRIRRRVCRVGYEERLQREQAQTYSMTGGGAFGSGVIVQVGARRAAMKQEFETVLLNAVNTDPMLNEQVIRLMALKSAIEDFETPRQQRRREREAREADAGAD